MNPAVAIAVANKIFGLIDMGINYIEIKNKTIFRCVCIKFISS